MFPAWVVKATPAACETSINENKKDWLEAIRAVEHPACPVWNRGYRLACDIGPPLEDYGPSLDNGSCSVQDEHLCMHYSELFSVSTGLEPVPLVFVPTLSLPAFVSFVMPLVPKSKRFVLVTGLADWGPARVFGGGSESAGAPACELLLNDERLVAWWAEMLDFGWGVTQKCLEALPLGVDLHTLAFKPQDRPLWGPSQSPTLQLQQLWASAAVARHEDPRVYVCWGIRNRRRLAVTRAAESLPSVYALETAAPGTLLRTEFWNRAGRCAWVACVQGYGRDCHRTWEALALGGGVVVEDMPFTRRVLRGHPAVFVGSGSEEEGLEDINGGVRGEGGCCRGGEYEGGGHKPRHRFLGPWKALPATLPSLHAARVAARSQQQLQLLACQQGGGVPPWDAGRRGLLGNMALKLKDGLTFTGQPPVVYPHDTSPILLISTILSAMRRSASLGTLRE